MLISHGYRIDSYKGQFSCILLSINVPEPLKNHTETFEP